MEDDMGIKHWPAVERPREKLLARGAQALSDAELLAIFIGSGIAGHTALDLSRLLLARFGDLRATLDANHEEFCRTPGVGDACYALLQAALELGRRYLECRIRRGTPLGCPADTRRFLTARLRSHEHEVFACLFLDNRHRLICFEELFRGTVNGASVYPREIAKRGLYHNAAAIIIAHPRRHGPHRRAPDGPLRGRRRPDRVLCRAWLDLTPGANCTGTPGGGPGLLETPRGHWYKA
jgi:DNA repair protein RadC